MRRPESGRKKYMGIFIVAVMILSTFGFIASFNKNTQQDYSYNGFGFEQKNNQWVTEADTPFGKQEFAFLFHPLSLTVDVPVEIPNTLKQVPEIVLAFDPNITEIQYVDAARFELSQYLITSLGKNLRHAVTQNTTAYSFPVETCSKKSDMAYITFGASNESSASINENCITITTFNPSDYIEYSEKIIYMMLGVI
ncbi:hypothetical protein HY497_01780 [Candidatus Woesearchaeota archaeon]|nr:hypothetical protein [Candidatus Woesearchaeota archaeon]